MSHCDALFACPMPTFFRLNLKYLQKVTLEIFLYFTYPIDVNVTLRTLKLKMAVEYEIVIIIAVCHSMTYLCLPVDEGLISIYLRHAYVTLLHHPLLKHYREGSCLQAILFQICYECKVCRVNNILIIGHLRDTDIRQCIHNHTNLVYCVNSHIG